MVRFDGWCLAQRASLLRGRGDGGAVVPGGSESQPGGGLIRNATACRPASAGSRCCPWHATTSSAAAHLGVDDQAGQGAAPLIVVIVGWAGLRRRRVRS